MSDWAAKRFWTDVTTAACEGGFEVLLDGRKVKTPAKTPLVLPSQALAQAVADEWAAQDGAIDPMSMPMTRSANATLDKVIPQHAEVAQMLADYGDSDLLCYRADGPDGLVLRQAQAWDPLLDWAKGRFGAALLPRAGVMHAAQDPRALASLSKAVHGQDPWALTALHDLVTISGSLVLGLAALEGAFSLEDLWRAARIDEDWQTEQWGEDEEAQENATARQGAFYHAASYHNLCGSA
jgi:chaperone required for assembly of F1-ATPase